MNKVLLLISGVIGVLMTMGCEPRIKMDFAQWGDHAIIDNVQIFKYEVDDDPILYETIQDVGSISGYRRIIISQRAQVDLDSSTVTVSLIGEESLNDAGLIFYHQSTKVEPLNGSPKGGIVGDLSQRSFKYRLHSADATERDWTIIIE